MANTLKETVRTKETTTGPAPAAGVAKEAQRLRTSQEYLDDYKKLVDDPQYQRSVPEDTRQTLKDAIGRAESLYQQRASQNDWLEVAQTLGRAVAQFAGASSGGSSKNMSNLNMGPGIDYGARSDRAFREYQQGLKNLGDQDTLNRQFAGDQAALKKEGFGRQEDYLKTAVKNAQERESDKERFNRTKEIETSRATREGNREDKRDVAADAKSAAELRRLQLKDLDQQEKSLSEQLKAGQALATQIQQEGDLSKKSAEKMQQKYGQLAGAAGVDLYGALDTFEKTAPKKPKSFLGFEYGEEIDRSKGNKNLLDALGLTEKLEQLKQIRAQKKGLLQGQPQSQQMPATQSPTGPSNPSTGQQQGEGSLPVQPSNTSTESATVQIKGPSGQVAEMTKEAAQKYLSKPGYSLVK